MKRAAFNLKITGSRNGQDLSPQSLDVDEWIGLFEHARNLLYPEGKKGRDHVGVSIEAGSVKLRLIAPASVVTQTQALLAQAGETQQLGILHPKQADAVGHFQSLAELNSFTFHIGSPAKPSQILLIDCHTIWERSEKSWLPLERYVSGVVTNAGGKSNPNIHLDTEEYGLLIIAVAQDLLKQDDKNRLYKTQEVRILIFQDRHSGELDKKSAKLLEFIDHDLQGETPDEYLDRLTQQASSDWKKIKDPEYWLRELRDYE